MSRTRKLTVEYDTRMLVLPALVGQDERSSMKTRNLRKQARRSAKNRGHRLGKFSALTGSGWSESTYAVCSSCGRDVAVYPNPAPNGIEITGEAVALDCGSAK